MTGPPTPPPSSALEIEDAVRSSVPPQVQPVGETSTSQASGSGVAVSATSRDLPMTSYQILFPKLAELALSSQPKYRELAQTAEIGDLAAEGLYHQSRLLLTTPLVLAHLISGDASSARFALERLPDTLASHPLSHALFQLVAAVSERKYDRLYSKADQILQVQAQAPFAEVNFSPMLAKLVEAFLDAFRRKTFALLSRAYTSIPLSLAQIYLGFSEEQLLSVAQEYKWSYNAATQVLAPAPPSTSKPTSNGVLPGPSSLAAFSTVASGLILDVD